MVMMPTGAVCGMISLEVLVELPLVALVVVACCG